MITLFGIRARREQHRHSVCVTHLSELADLRTRLAFAESAIVAGETDLRHAGDRILRLRAYIGSLRDVIGDPCGTAMAAENARLRDRLAAAHIAFAGGPGKLTCRQLEAENTELAASEARLRDEMRDLADQLAAAQADQVSARAANQPLPPNSKTADRHNQ